MRLLVSFGTRPEYIKIKPLLHKFICKTLFTGQHVNLLDNVKCDFKINIENKLNNRLNNIMSSILSYDSIFDNIDYVLVQGDTTSAMAVAMSAFNHKIKIIHLEAGLRTFNNMSPYPEEMNRKIISNMAHIHLCPTNQNIANLNNENITKNIYLTGNTGLDNIKIEDSEITYDNTIIITMHRNENINNIKLWFEALSELAQKYTDLNFIIPLHPNPLIQKHKNSLKGVNIIEPVDYDKFINMCKTCKFIISDSGGIQEEASFLNKKIIICRDSTERQEILGIWGVLCPEPRLLSNIFDSINENYIVDKNNICPFGNGNATEKIVKILEQL